MSDHFKKIFETIIPFIVIGIGIAIFIGLLFMFFYVVVWGVLIGAVLWAGNLIRQYLFPTKTVKKTQGRIIEHDDKK